MKNKIRAQIPSLIMETLNKDAEFFYITKEHLCNEVLYKFPLKNRVNYQKDLSHDEKVYLQFTLNKDNKRYYSDLIRQSIGLSESEIIREIFSTYAVLHPSLRESYLYKEKINFISSVIKECKILRIDTCDGIVKGKVNKLFRCKELGYLKIEINEKSYYLSHFRIV